MITVHHPSYYNDHDPLPTPGNRDWIKVLPFFNANFFLFQNNLPTIDWHNLSDAPDPERLSTVNNLMKKLVKTGRGIKQNWLYDFTNSTLDDHLNGKKLHMSMYTVGNTPYLKLECYAWPE